MRRTSRSLARDGKIRRRSCTHQYVSFLKHMVRELTQNSAGLYCLAFTTYANVHWIAPIISTIPFGTGMCYIFTSTFTYLTVAYRHLAAEALTGNAVMRTMFAAAFPLFSTGMYNTLGTVGATALLAGLMTVMAPLPCVFPIHHCDHLR